LAANPEGDVSGPPPRPTALKILRGNPGKQKINRDEPKPPPSPATPPTWLRGDALALAIWAEEAPRLLRLGLLTEIDRLLFAALCERTAIYRRAARALRKGLTQQTAGGAIPRPEVSIARGALYGFSQLCARFGMTPADRARLMATPERAVKSKWAGLVKR